MREKRKYSKPGRKPHSLTGSGLGLWLTHWIVSNHDGTITATASETGTMMTVTIPRKAAANPQERLAKLTRARDQYQAVFEESPDAIVIVNDDARVVDANPGVEDVYGVNRRALLGRRLSEFVPADIDFDTAWEEFQRTGVERDTVLIAGDDDVIRQIEYSAVAGIVPGEHLVISRDVTDRVRREEELK